MRRKENKRVGATICRSIKPYALSFAFFPRSCLLLSLDVNLAGGHGDSWFLFKVIGTAAGFPGIIGFQECFPQDWISE